MSIILASGSPRRKELLRFITDAFTVRVSDAKETENGMLSPEETVLCNARLKGDAVAADAEADDVVIACDTVVSVDGRILGKPRTKEEAFSMLSLLSGRTHEVYSGVYIKKGARSTSFTERTEVAFYPLTADEINAYIAGGDPFDKAGAYGIQSGGALFVRGIVGDYYNVMGFPVARTARALREFLS
ncbi:MAG: septum formation protein Maf [Clostridia bacterium]|nr:septum formation protein Maf [Clostridia bacterium]